MRCLTPGDTHCISTGSNSIVFISVSINNIEDTPLWISTPDEFRCNRCPGKDRRAGGYYIPVDHRNCPIVSHHYGQRIRAEQNCGHIHYSEDIAGRIRSLVHLSDIRKILSCCHYTGKSFTNCPHFDPSHFHFLSLSLFPKGKMVIQLAKDPCARLLKHVVRCYLRLSDNTRLVTIPLGIKQFTKYFHTKQYLVFIFIMRLSKDFSANFQ